MQVIQTTFTLVQCKRHMMYKDYQLLDKKEHVVNLAVLGNKEVIKETTKKKKVQIHMFGTIKVHQKKDKDQVLHCDECQYKCSKRYTQEP